MTQIYVIKPFIYLSMWVFDDEKFDLVKEPFISSADEIIDLMVKGIPNADDGFCLVFSAQPFSGYQVELEWQRGDSDGNWYYLRDLDKEGWLCPALFKYFDSAPLKLFVQFKAREVDRPFRLQLLVPDDEILDIQVRCLNGNQYQSLAETDLFQGTLLLWGDIFSAVPVNSIQYQLKEIEQPSAMSHYKVLIGNFVMSGDIKTDDARNDAINTLNNMFDAMYSTPPLRLFLNEHGGTFDYWDFLICQYFFIHIPAIYKTALFEQLPRLCPDLNPVDMVEIFSGENSELI